MTYNTWLSVLATLLGVIGTIKSILALLKMGLKDVMYERSALGQDTKELSTLQQVYDARVGIALVIVSSIVQVISELLNEINCLMFCLVIIVAFAFSCVWWISMYIIYKKGKTRLIEKMPEEIRNSLDKR